MADFDARSDEQPVPAAGEAVSNLDTPSILCDLDRLERNIADWQALMDRNEVRFRPHIKTHKIPDIARMQVEAGARGIICAKPSEAEPFVAAGIDDVCIAYPVLGPQKWRRIAAMAAGGASNRSIAESLFLTKNPVEWHLRNIYRKLGISARTELGGALGD